LFFVDTPAHNVGVNGTGREVTLPALSIYVVAAGVTRLKLQV
jgi:hypothetical protein